MPKQKDPNEGCYNCGAEEDYPGARNYRIRYLCSPCVQGYAKSCIKAYESIEAALKLANKPLLRLTRKRKYKLKGVTLATC